MLLPALLNGNKLLAMTPSWSELTPRERKHCHLELESEEDPRTKRQKTAANPAPARPRTLVTGHLLYRAPSGPPPQLGTQQDRPDESCQYGQPGWQKEVAFSAGCPEAADSKKPNQEKCRAIFNLGVSTPMSPSTEGSVAPL